MKLKYGPIPTLSIAVFVAAQTRGNGEASSPSRTGLWQPAVGSTFQIILNGIIDPNFVRRDIAKDIDVFDTDLFDTPKDVIDDLHKQGKRVVCYFSAGSTESWRPDYFLFNSSDKGSPLPGWYQESWLDVRSPTVWDVMRRRIKYASAKGCDGIDPDNVDSYENRNGGGFAQPLTSRDLLKYTKRLAREAHKYNVSMGLKNSLTILPSLQGDVQFAVNEECAIVNTCGEYKFFLDPESAASFNSRGDGGSRRGGFWNRRTKRQVGEVAEQIGKPVFHIEYVNDTSAEARTLPENTATAALRAELCLQPEPAPEPAAAPESSSRAASPVSGTVRRRHARPQMGGGWSGSFFGGAGGGGSSWWDNAHDVSPEYGAKFSTVIKALDLGSWTMFCDGSMGDTRTTWPRSAWGGDRLLDQILAEPEVSLDEGEEIALEEEVQMAMAETESMREWGRGR